MKLAAPYCLSNKICQHATIVLKNPAPAAAHASFIRGTQLRESVNINCRRASPYRVLWESLCPCGVSGGMNTAVQSLIAQIVGISHDCHWLYVSLGST